MTNIDLDAIRARAEAATRGPWEWDLGEDGKPRRARAALLSFSDHIFWCSALGWPTDADAEFISHARTDVPALIAEVERLRAEPRTVGDLTARHFGRRMRIEGDWIVRPRSFDADDSGRVWVENSAGYQRRYPLDAPVEFLADEADA